MSWQLQEAKQHFSEVVKRARQGEPQIVTKHGKEAAVVVSIEEYRCQRPRESPWIWPREMCRARQRYL